ncbi:MAG: hypothetical protein AB7G12_12680 [Thermoanaerobaculia bacterium]
MPIGDPGKEQFRRAMTTKLRNRHINAGIFPLILFRQELLGNDDLSNRGGFDSPTQAHFVELLVYADRWRRRITHNPDKASLGDKIEHAITVYKKDKSGAKILDGQNKPVEVTIRDAENPFGGDDIQNATGGLTDLQFALDGSDDDIPLMSKLQMKSGNALLLLGAVDQAIVAWTRLNSRDRTRFITRFDSMRIYGMYQEILGYLASFGGDDNIIDVAQVLPSQEPLGPDDSPNRKAETSGNGAQA